MATLTLAATDPKKHKIIRISLLVIAAIFLIAGLGGYFLITISNVGSYRY
jgi:flagellar basal body-associated protein FliL